MTPSEALNHLLSQDERTQMAGEELRAEINTLREMFDNERTSHESAQEAINDRDETCYELEHKLTAAQAENERLRAELAAVVLDRDHYAGMLRASEAYDAGNFETIDSVIRRLTEAIASDEATEAAKAGGVS